MIKFIIFHFTHNLSEAFCDRVVTFSICSARPPLLENSSYGDTGHNRSPPHYTDLSGYSLFYTFSWMLMFHISSKYRFNPINRRNFCKTLLHHHSCYSNHHCCFWPQIPSNQRFFLLSLSYSNHDFLRPNLSSRQPTFVMILTAFMCKKLSETEQAQPRLYPNHHIFLH